MTSVKRDRSRKRNIDDVYSSEDRDDGKICILHSDKSNNEHFTYMSSVKEPSERLKRLHEIRDLRLQQPYSSNNRMETVCSRIPINIEANHGYHRDCYNYFTKNADRLRSVDTTLPGTSSDSRNKQRRISGDSFILFPKDCIFPLCRKEIPVSVKKGGNWTTDPLVKFKSDSWQKVLDHATRIQDEEFLLRIRGYDLFASEAYFHSKCRERYLLIDRERNKDHVDSESRKYQQQLEETHGKAFSEVCKIVSTDILVNEKVMKMSELRQIYIANLESTNFANPGYRSEKLKTKLEAHFKDKIAFCQLDTTGKFQSQLVYNANMKLEKAVKTAYILGGKNVLAEAASYLRNAILTAYDNADTLRWPATVDTLANVDSVLPKDLETFLKFVFSGRTTDTSTQTNRLVSSIGQDICRAAVTNGEWKLPKHVLITMTLRHLYRSHQLTTLLNRLGHCESHAFGIELETAIANALEESSSILTNQIIRYPALPSLFHSEFDNFDQLISTLRGTDSIHTAHGIMLQEIVGDPEEDTGGIRPAVPEAQRSTNRILTAPVEEELPECWVGQRKSPGYPVKNKIYPGCERSLELSDNLNVLWLFIRKDKSPAGQEVPGWTGFVSSTGTSPTRLTTIDYYPIINHPITEYRTVQECLQYAENATREVGQLYTVTTFDLGVCMKALPLIWNNSERYSKHIVLIGTFHLICAYFKMVGKKMDGSGLSDIMLEAGLIGSGSIQGVFSGKHYERAMHCHKVVVEALERMLLNEFLEAENMDELFAGLPQEAREILETLVNSPSEETLNDAINDTSIHELVVKYTDYKQRVRDGQIGKTAKFWVSYMDHIWRILALIRAVKTNNFLLYCSSISSLTDLFFSFGGQNYARYLSYFTTFIANLDDTHPGARELLQRGGMSVARSFIPGNRCAVDKTMEETFMRHAKSHGGAGGSGAGVTGLTSNYNTYQRWVKTSHERAKFVEATFHMADMLSDKESGTKHRELRPAEILKGDVEVNQTVEAIEGFVNPFNVEDTERLYCVSSGAMTQTEIEHDILLAEERGKQAKETFVTERLEKKDKFFEPIKRLNLKTIENNGKATKVKSTNNKVIQYKQQSNIAMQLLVQSQIPDREVNLEELLKYPMTPVPFSIGTADGFLAKTDKSKGLKHVTEGIEHASMPKDKVLIIEDGNALFHALTNVPPNFKLISERLFNMTSKTADVIYSTDMYREDSVKAMERKRRGCGEKLLIKGENTKKPGDWKSFLTNDENKKQLVNIMSKCWESDAYAQKLQRRKVIFICNGEAMQYTSEDGETTTKTTIEELRSTQEETDTRVILYALYGRDNGYDSIQIRSPDSDIFFIILYYMREFETCNILFDTGTGNKRRLYNMGEIASGLTEEYRSALLGLHAYTGCDTTSAFKGRGHVKPIKVLEKRPRSVGPLATLGNDWTVTEGLTSDLDSFTCAMYGNTRVNSVDNLRLLKMKEVCDDGPDASKTVDLSLLPPCKQCLSQHIRRVNYQVCIWKRSHMHNPNIPKASDGHGWTVGDNGVLEPLWLDGDILPPQMVDVLEEMIDDLGGATDDSDIETDDDNYELIGDEDEV